MAEETPETTSQSDALPERVEARATKDPAVRLFIFAGMLLGAGLWFLYDGHIAKKYSYKPFAEDMNAWSTWAMNYFGPFVLIPAGLVFAVWGVVALRRVLVADNEGIGYVGKDKIAWDKITEVDASQLKGKNMLYVHYDDEKKLTLDSWKLEQFSTVVDIVERNVSDDRIKT